MQSHVDSLTITRVSLLHLYFGLPIYARWLCIHEKILDQCLFLENCPPTASPNLTWTLTSFFGQRLGLGRGRWAVFQKHTLIQHIKNSGKVLLTFLGITEDQVKQVQTCKRSRFPVFISYAICYFFILQRLKEPLYITVNRSHARHYQPETPTRDKIVSRFGVYIH